MASSGTLLKSSPWRDAPQAPRSFNVGFLNMPAIASLKDLRAAQKEGLSFCAMPYLSSKGETTAREDALCPMRPVGFGWKNESRSS